MTSTEISIVLLAAVVAALIKTIAGMGYPLILIPVLAMFLDLDEAVSIVAISNLVLNLTLVWSTKSQRDRSMPLAWFLMSGAIGAAVGAALLTRVDQVLLRWALVILIVAFIGSRLLDGNKVQSQPASSQLRATSVPVGAAAGFFQGAAGISGPLVSPYFLWAGVRNEPYVFAIASVFSVVGASQIIVLALDGAFTRGRWLLGFALVIVAQAMVPFGARLRDRLNPERFEQAVLLLLVVAAISITVRNV